MPDYYRAGTHGARSGGAVAEGEGAVRPGVLRGREGLAGGQEVDGRDCCAARLGNGTLSFSIDVAFGRLERRDFPESVSLDAFEPHPRSALPGAGILGRSARDSELLSWAQLDAVQMRALRMVSDWPLGYRWCLVELGAGSRALSALHRLGLVLYAWEGRHKRCVLSDAGIQCLTWIDRSRPHLWKKRWAVSVVHGDEGYKVSGGDLPSSSRLSLDGGSIRTVENELRHQDQLIETCAMLAQGLAGDRDNRGIADAPERTVGENGQARKIDKAGRRHHGAATPMGVNWASASNMSSARPGLC